MCDTSGAAAVCTDICSGELACQDGQCVAPTVLECSPACGPCQVCDTSSGTPQCTDNCAPGLDCQDGACVLPSDPCGGACASCQLCDTSHGVPFCVDNCPGGFSCDATGDVCRPAATTQGFDHSGLSELAGPFTADIAGGKEVTAKCLGCHPQAGQQMLDTAHWKWVGPTPNLEGYESSSSVGKRTLVNNFCVAVPSNEGRCSQCHVGYGYKDKTFDFTDSSNLDCLSCHSPNYKKAKKVAGQPHSNVDMVLAAKTVGPPQRTTCGRCHFNAGGGDNVKKGDLGSAMGNPTAAADVHMGHATTPFSCTSCHVASGHKIPGQGVHLPVQEGRIGCQDCHSAAPHATANLNNHALDVACQTCHIPGFSRQQPTKVDWDWSTAGNMTRGNNTGKETQTIDGATVPVYVAKKGDFVWEKNVRPSYAWYDGRVARMQLQDDYPAGAGTLANRINLGGPTASKSDAAAKIFPFKVMRGRQPVDTTSRKVLTPKLFGSTGFWANIPAAADYTAQKVEDLWTTSLTAGARYAGQIGSSEAFTGRATGARPWDWAYTEMWMGINHEVAPATQALDCSSCHGAPTDEWDWTALGYSCDPMSDPAKCGSRHR
jgi:octaheme c-type cytochrome (tetrathionate reductase family)